MSIGTVSRLWRYPVKSMAGEELPAAHISWRGIPGDRGWAVYDETRAGITTAKRVAALRSCAARYVREPEPGAASPAARIRFPDGAEHDAADPAAAAALSTLAGKPMSLRALGAEGSEAAPRIMPGGDPPDWFRTMMGLLPDEPAPDMSAFTPERLGQMRQGNFFDAFPIHFITTRSIATLERLAPASLWHVDRFRANLLLDTAEAGDFPELAWVGKRVRVGTAVLQVVMGCPRCVMVTQAAGPAVPQDTQVMRTLVKVAAHTAGIYAGVVQPGEVRAGDTVELLAD